MKKNKNKNSKKTGKTFVEEPNGSASMINLDRHCGHDFKSHNENAGK